MPIKEYECRACANKFEALVMLSEPDPTACPKCGKSDLKRILSTFRISGAHKKSEGLSGDMPDMPGGMPDSLDMGGMDDMGGGAGMADDDAGEMPLDGGDTNTEEPI